MSIREPITILGAGVNGITTGVLLQLLGYNTQMITKDRADNPRTPDDPTFASLYPSASVIPHSVFGDDILSLFDDSQRIFEVLLAEQIKGLSINQHFEVFEYKTEIPDYAPVVKNFRPLSEPWQSEKNVPNHPATSKLYGWSFDCFFADWPVYIPQLFRWYKELGGEINIKTLEPEDIQRLNSPIVNCTGLGGRHFFEDSASSNMVLKGHLVHIKDAPPIRNDLGQCISYNYNPMPQTYADAAGNPQDLYCYPRQDGWIIGGSRLAGTLDKHGIWSGRVAGAKCIPINGVPVPAPIIDCNWQILSSSYNIDLDAYPHREAVVGYRYIRNRRDGLRLERSEELGSVIIHNYGHGGAGVTLSWGCAIEVARLLADEIPEPAFPIMQTTLFKKLRKICKDIGSKKHSHQQ